MRLDHWPLFEELADCQSILLAGAGGGYDVYSGLPLYFALRAIGKTVHLANLSFATLPEGRNSRLTPACVAVTADTPCGGSYFPELRLAEWFRQERGEEQTVYAFPQTGVAPLIEAYRHLQGRLNLDAVILVDGGTDSLMKGDEVGLGTPEEDIASIAAVHSLVGCKKLLACIGFGVDTFHGVCHAQFLEAVAELTRIGAFLGVSTVLPNTHGAAEFLSAVNHANQNTVHRQSIVANSIASAVEGHFGNSHRTRRTEGSELWISPLMPMYWAFQLEPVARRNLYLDSLRETRSLFEVT
ncbi:MAG: DUF1152 domain-containing protein, partial [Verrucomicrobium sp.]